MRRWLTRLLVVWAVLFSLGWALVYVSGYGGNSTGGSELVWRVGGVMVYAAAPIMLMIVFLGLVATGRAAARRRRRSA